MAPCVGMVNLGKVASLIVVVVLTVSGLAVLAVPAFAAGA